MRRLSVVVRALEDSTVEIENALEPCEAHQRVMTTYENDIADASRPAIRSKLNEIRSEIRELKGFYELDADVISERRRISTRLAMLAIDLTECLSKYLRAYGEIPEAEQTALDQRIRRLEALVNDVNRLVVSSPAEK